MVRRCILRTLVIALGAALSQAGARQGERPGNILLLLADDMGVEMVGAYDPAGDPAPTPVLDRLAAEGVLFRNAWATPTCSPTRATILTGRYGFRTGIGLYISPRSTAELPASEWILPELLDRAAEPAYSHAVIGKWHLSNRIDAATRAGFATFSGSRANFRTEQNYHRWLKVKDGKEAVCTTYATTDTVNEALAFIEATPEPWFLYLPFNAPHARFSNPPEELHSQRLNRRSVHCEPRFVYKAMIEAMDTEIGRLLAGMGDRLERTTVLFMGDNGTPNEVLARPIPAKHGKLSVFEGGVHVPLIVWSPNVVAPGREVHAPVSSTDLFATCLELAGLSLPEDLPAGLVTDSLSLLPYLTDPEAPARRGRLFTEMFGPNLSAERNVELRAVRNARYKLIHRTRPEERWSFYDLLLDPHETRDLMQVPWDRELELEHENLAAWLEELLHS